MRLKTSEEEKKERRKLYQRLRKELFGEELNAKRREYKKENKEYISKLNKEHYLKHKEDIIKRIKKNQKGQLAQIVNLDLVYGVVKE